MNNLTQYPSRSALQNSFARELNKKEVKSIKQALSISNKSTLKQLTDTKQKYSETFYFKHNGKWVALYSCYGVMRLGSTPDSHKAAMEVDMTEVARNW